MDVEKLHIVLQQSFSPDATLRDPAEETIRNLKHIKGATIMLLQVTAEKQVGFMGTFFLFLARQMLSSIFWLLPFQLYSDLSLFSSP
jgi:hypothetical protein